MATNKEWKDLVKTLGNEFSNGIRDFVVATNNELREYGEVLARLTIRVMQETSGYTRERLLEEIGANALLIAERLRIKALKTFNKRIEETVKLIARVAINTALSVI